MLRVSCLKRKQITIRCNERHNRESTLGLLRSDFHLACFRHILVDSFPAVRYARRDLYSSRAQSTWQSSHTHACSRAETPRRLTGSPAVINYFHVVACRRGVAESDRAWSGRRRCSSVCIGSLCRMRYSRGDIVEEIQTFTTRCTRVKSTRYMNTAQRDTNVTRCCPVVIRFTRNGYPLFIFMRRSVSILSDVLRHLIRHKESDLSRKGEINKIRSNDRKETKTERGKKEE